MLIRGRPQEPGLFQLPGLIDLKGVVHGFSMRRDPARQAGEFNMGFGAGGNLDHVVQNRRAFFQRLGIPLERAVFMQQAHRDQVVVVHHNDAGKGAAFPQSAVPGADALLTDETNLFLAALGADCALILLCDTVLGVVGIVHAGWRGTVQGVVEKTVRRMKAEWGCNPANIFAGVGPSIGVCCYEVGTDVVEAARNGRGAAAILTRKGRFYFDLRLANMKQLLAEGLLRSNIVVTDVCTSCHHDLFFSYRRDGAMGGRFCGVIGRVER